MSKGLEIAQTFYREWGLPYLQQHFPHLENRVMAGLFHGSQIYGADDDPLTRSWMGTDVHPVPF